MHNNYLRQTLLSLCLLCAGVASAVTTFSAGKKYVLTPMNDTSVYLNEDADGKLSVAAYDADGQMFWQFVPTENENCYYIQNAVTGNYIVSCNAEGNTRMTTSTTPVEYYIGVNGTNIRMTSTDCDNYADTSQSPWGLNRQGETTNVVVWKAGSSNVNSWWTVSEVSATETDTTFAADKYYNIVSKANANYYMNEEASGALDVTSYDVSQRIFWQFIPTANDSCYYIRNAVTGRYIQSCKGTRGSASKITTGETPVEFFVGYNSGYFRLTSTDCDDYASTSAQPNCLNKDGASSSIVIWYAAPTDRNSWWAINETEMLYEIHPFTPSEAVGTPAQKYYIKNLSGNYLSQASSGDFSWGSSLSAATQWYFVGESNAAGGYQIVNAAGDVAYNEGALYLIEEGTSGYYFANASTGAAFTASGDSLITFEAVRSSYSIQAGVYQMPCATLSSTYIASVSLTGAAAATPLTYPVQVQSGTSLTDESTKPSTGFTIYTKSKATLMQGLDATLNLTLSAAPAEGDELYAYFDWNRDGIFETSYTLDAAQQVTQTIPVPADAAEGKSRMRLRLTASGLAGAEDDVIGQTLDFILNVTPQAPFTAEATVNDTARGTATIDGTTAHAAAKGNAEFICWREGNNVVGLSEDYAFTLDHNVRLTAYFSPNTDTDTRLQGVLAQPHASLLQISARDRRIVVESSSKVRSVRVYTPSGALVARGNKATLDVSHLIPGSYIVKVQTTTADKSLKTILQ